MWISFRCCALCDVFLSHVQKYYRWQEADARRRRKFEAENPLFNVENSESAPRATELKGPTHHLPVYTSNPAAIGSIPAILEVRFREQFPRRCSERIHMFSMPLS